MPMHCMTCGSQTEGKVRYAGSFAVELIAWLLAAVAGAATGAWWLMLGALGFTVWRQASRRTGCEHCGSASIVPADSPAAIAHRKQLTP